MKPEQMEWLKARLYHVITKEINALDLDITIKSIKVFKYTDMHNEQVVIEFLPKGKPNENDS